MGAEFDIKEKWQHIAVDFLPPLDKDLLLCLGLPNRAYCISMCVL